MRHLSTSSIWQLFIALSFGSCFHCVLSQPDVAEPHQSEKPTDAGTLKLHKNVSIGAVCGARASVKAVDATQGVLELESAFRGVKNDWPEQIVVTRETQFRVREDDVVIGDIKVGDVLLEVRNKEENAFFWARKLTVKSLAPLTLEIYGGSGGGSTSPELKPGQTPTDALIESLKSDEFRGIGSYFPRRSWLDPASGKLKQSTTLIVPRADKMIFVRSAPATPLKVSDLAAEQQIDFDGTVRPDGKMVATTIWTMATKSLK